MTIEEAYLVFDLRPEVTPQELSRTYRDLVQVWHPDRFQHSPRLQEKAQEKLKLINAAYELMTVHLRGRTDRPTVGNMAASKTAVAEALGKIISQGGYNNFAIVTADKTRNYYAQFSGARGSRELRGELVSNAFLEPRYWLSEACVRRLEQLGWTVFDGENYHKLWLYGVAGMTEETIAGEVVDALCSIYNASPEHLFEIELNLE